MKALALLLSLTAVPCFAQDATPNMQLPSKTTAPTEAQQPDRNLTILLVPSGKGTGFLIAVSPQGQLTTVPIPSVKDSLEEGYRPFTVGELVDQDKQKTDEIELLQKKLKELSDDYDLLTAKYNRLAGIASAPADSGPSRAEIAAQEKSQMRLMLFQSLLQRSAPPQTLRLNIANCTALPALCAH